MHNTDPAINDKATEMARLMTRILLGAQEGLPLFTIRLWVAQLAREAEELNNMICALGDDLFTMTLEADARLSETNAHWFGVGLEVHGLVKPVPDTIESLDQEA